MHPCALPWLLLLSVAVASPNAAPASDKRHALGARGLDGDIEPFYDPTGDACAASTPDGLDLVPNTQHAAANRTRPCYFVYLGDVRSPRQIRKRGGFRPYGLGWESDELAYIIERHFVGGPLGHGLEDRPRWHSSDGRFRTAYVSVMRDRASAETVYSGRVAPAWMYEIRATPNMLDLVEWSNQCFALGGVPWHQVRRYRRNQAGAGWQFNNDYDVAVFDVPELQSRLHTTSIDRLRSDDYDDSFPRILVDGIADPDRAYRDGDLSRAAAQWVISRAHRHLTEPQFPFAWREYTDDDDAVPGSPSREDDDDEGQGSSPARGMSESHRFMLATALRDASLTVTAAMAVDDGIEIAMHRSWPERVERAGCAYWTSLDWDLEAGSRTARRDTSQGQGNLLECAGLYMKAREWLLKNFGDDGHSAMPDSPLLANETALLLNGSYGVLNCEDLLGRLVFYQATLNGGNAAPHVPRLTNNDDYCKSVVLEMRGQRNRKHAPHDKPTRPTPADVVFLGHFLWPDEARRQGGFLPPGQQAHKAQSGKKTPLASPWADYVLKASITFGRAAKRAARLAAVETPGHSGIVYAVHASPNIVSLGSLAAVVGGVPWDQVMGWRRLPEDWERIAPRLDPSKRDELEQRFREALTAKSNHTFMTPNPDYDHKYNGFKTSVDVVQDMLDVDNDVVAFMNERGRHVGWSGSFPLFNATVVTGVESAAAKAEALVANPHPESEWAAMKEFVSNHRVAVASWVAVGALAMATGGLAGVGAGVADGLTVAGEGIIDGIASLFSTSSSASEMAGLMEESVQSTELEEAMSSRMSDVSQGLRNLIKGAHQA